MTVEAFVALGGNLGDVLAAFRAALRALAARGIRVCEVSSAYRTEAWLPQGETGPAPDYWNAVCRIETDLGARTLLAVLQGIEVALGRTRRRRWEARTLDLDLLTYGDEIVSGPGIEVPHPAIAERLFVLRPFVEIAPGARVPPAGQTVAALLARHPDPERGIRERRSGWNA